LLKTWALILLLLENKGSLLVYPRASTFRVFCLSASCYPRIRVLHFLLMCPKMMAKCCSKISLSSAAYKYGVLLFLEVYPKSKGFRHFLIALLNFETQKMVFFFFLEVYPKSRGILATFSWCSSFLIPNNGVLHFLKV